MKSDFIEIKQGSLQFQFAEYGQLNIQFNRTYRLADNQGVHGLPPSLGTFDLYHMESVLQAVNGLDAKRGGVVLPMAEKDATWLRFSPRGHYTYFAIQIAAGKVNAVSGMPWQEALVSGEYMETPKQPWIDGFNQGNGVIRQFVSTALGNGNTVEELATGEAKWGGMQIIVYPLNQRGRDKVDALNREMNQRNRLLRSASGNGTMYALEAASGFQGSLQANSANTFTPASATLGMEQGAQIVQTFHTPTFGPEDYDTHRALRVFVTMKEATQFNRIVHKQEPKTIEPKKVHQKKNPLPEPFSTIKHMDSLQLQVHSVEFPLAVKVGPAYPDVPDMPKITLSC